VIEEVERASGAKGAGEESGVDAEMEEEGVIESGAKERGCVIGNFRIHRNKVVNKKVLFGTEDQLADFVAQAHKPCQGLGWPRAHLVVPGGGCFEETRQLTQLLLSELVAGFIFFGFSNAFPEHVQSGINFALFTFVQNDAKHFPDVFQGLEMVAFVTEDMDEPDDSPTLEFLEAGRDVGAGNSESFGDVFGVEGLRGEE
jgi:hypothetical protein